MKRVIAQHRCQGAPWLAGAALASLAVLVAGCGSAPATHYHTLMPAASASAPAELAARLEWGLGPVAIPSQVDQPQWVVRVADGSLAVLENERWIAPLGDEIRGAVVERLTKSFGPPSMGSTAGGTSGWQIRIDVQRFDLVPDREARIESDWSVRGAGTSVSCHAVFSQPVTDLDYLALGRAQQQAVARLADAIGASLKASNKASRAEC